MMKAEVKKSCWTVPLKGLSCDTFLSVFWFEKQSQCLLVGTDTVLIFYTLLNVS
jgi:hypothetical protein